MARSGIFAFTALATLSAGAALAQVRTGEAAYGDWRTDAPGVVRKITPADLPAPMATPTSAAVSTIAPKPEGATLKTLPGFSVAPFAKLEGPRLIRTAPNGDLFVAETQAGRIRVLRAKDGATAPDQTETFADKLDRPFGIAFYPAADPKWVYVANVDAVVRFPYRAGDLTARGPAEVVVPKLTQSKRGHSTRDVAFSPDGKRMFIAVGSGSNVAEEVAKKTPEETKAWAADHALGADWGVEVGRADVMVADPDGKNLKVFAAGIRNCVGLAVQPKTGEVWCATNERDLLGDDLPPDYVTRVKAGGFYGWPWYYIGDHEDPRPNVKDQRPDLKGQVSVPDVLIQPHSAPLQETFYTAASGSSLFPAEYRGDLFVALHGSWNRGKRTGYKVVRLKLHDGVPTGEYQDFLTGFVVDDQKVWGRPVGVTVAHDGALLVTDDGGDRVWRISYGAGAQMRPGAALIALALAALPATGFTADAVKGEAIYEDRCSMCHVEEGQGQGPDLKGVVGRKAGTLAGFNYTAAMKASGLTWTPAELDRFLQGPMKLVPGTTMPMTVPDSSERQDLIAFLASRK